jgi:hypothetical protein
MLRTTAASSCNLRRRTTRPSWQGHRVYSFDTAPASIEEVDAMILLLVILIVLLIGGAGLLAFLVKSILAAGLLGILAIVLLIWLLIGRARS